MLEISDLIGGKKVKKDGRPEVKSATKTKTAKDAKAKSLPFKRKKEEESSDDSSSDEDEWESEEVRLESLLP